MNKQLFLQINLGIGDHVVARMFLDGIKHKYDKITIIQAQDALAYWFKNDPTRRNFNTQLGSLVFSDPPYFFIPNPTSILPFYPTERIIRELNNKPVKPNLDNLCVGKSIDIKNYVVITTKVREFPKVLFDQCKDKITPALQNLTKDHTIVILGEREVQRTIEYDAAVNRHRVFGIYNYLKDILPQDKIIDLTVPELGIATSPFPQFQQDCLILKEAKTVITIGTGGNYWLSAGISKQTIGLRADSELDRLGITEYIGVSLTKDIDQFVQYLSNLH